MLVLSRQRDESIVIGDDIFVTIVDIRGDKVRIGIECPNEIPVHRREVYDAIQRENQQNPSKLELKADSNLVQPIDLNQELNKYISSGKYKEAFELERDHRGLASREQLYLITEGLYKGNK